MTTLHEERDVLPDGTETTFSTNLTMDQRWFFVLAHDSDDPENRQFSGWYDVSRARRALTRHVATVRATRRGHDATIREEATT